MPWILTNIPWKRIFIGILLQKRILSHSRRSTGRDRYYIVCTYYLMQEFKPRSKGPVAEFWIGRFFFQLDQVGGWTNNACNFFSTFFAMICLCIWYLYIIHLLGFAFFKATFSISVSGKWMRFWFKMCKTVTGIPKKSISRIF